MVLTVIGSTLLSPGYSMWNPWNGGWTAEIPDGFHGMVDEFYTFGRWILYFWWMDSMEWGIDSIPFPDGFHTISIWNPGGISF